jgi:hypothetical protein
VKIHRILILITIVILFNGCDIKQFFFNPSRIEWMPSPSESRTMWGEEQAKITSNITRSFDEISKVETVYAK